MAHPSKKTQILIEKNVREKMASPNFGGQNHENFGLVSDIEALFYAKPRNIYNSMYIVN